MPALRSGIVAIAICLLALHAPARLASAPSGNWPGFRGPSAAGVADGQHLPDTWDAATGRNVAWKVEIPGLAHSSPIVWGDRLFLTSAVSSRADATFKPGLYGEGTASEDRTPQKWVVLALDRQTGKTLWQRTAYEGVPREKRHIKATYANATPVTDGRYVVAFFGSQGLYAFDMQGTPVWKKDLGVLEHRRLRSARVRVGHGELADHLQGSRHRSVRHAARVLRAGGGHQDRADGVEDGAHGIAVVGHTDRRTSPARRSAPSS